MPTKISQLESALDITANDIIPIIDVEDDGMAPSGTNKKITAQLLADDLAGIVSDGSIATSKLASGALPSGVTVSPANIEAGALPNDVTVSSSNIVDGTIVNADINASAAIAGTKVSPNFGSQAISTTSSITCGSNSTISTLSVGRGKSEISSNTAIGKDAINPTVAVTGTLNTAVGFEALQNLTSGAQNVAIGYRSLKALTGGIYNTSVGAESLMANSSQGNTAIGYGTLPVCTSGQNTAIGGSALASVSTGEKNTAVGVQALSSMNGSNNTAIGWNSGQFATAYTETTCLGANSNVTGNYQLQLGSSSTTPYANAQLQVRSDERDKADIKDTELGLDFICRLRPVDYKWDMREDYRPEKPEQPPIGSTEEEVAQHKEAMEQWLESIRVTNITHDGSKKRNRYHHGLIAQEVKDVIEETGVDFGGFQDHSVNGGEDVFSIGYSELIAPLIKSVQELKSRVEELESK
jgi:hypothetical protein